MVTVALSRFIILFCGTLYPAYKSYKAVRTKDVREYVKWMMYWIVFALFCFTESITDTFISFLPFYYEAKIIFVLWLLSPWTKGASILYRKWIHPTLAKHESDIDALLDQAKSESYNQIMRLGSQGLLCARDIVAQAALRGQAQLVNQLQRSVSVQDVSMQESEKRRHPERITIHEVQEDFESEEVAYDLPEQEQEQPLRRSSRSRSRSRPLPEGSDNYPATIPRRNPTRRPV